MSRKAENREVSRGRGELEHELLDSRQAEVALLDDLDIVVDEADCAVRQRETDTRVNERRNPERVLLVHADKACAEEVVEHNAQYSDNYGTDNEHNTAHSRCALLILVPRRSDIENRLTEVKLVQELYNRFAERRGNRERRQSCYE